MAFVEKSFNPAEARDGFKMVILSFSARFFTEGFNPAEARDGFKMAYLAVSVG